MIETGAVSPKKKKEILRARAAALAREPEQQETAGEALSVVEFLLASDHYGIALSSIHEVYPLRELTPLPCTPPFVYGIINVRGQIHTVINLKTFFDLPEQGLSDLNQVLIVHGRDFDLGILADAVIGVRAVPLRDIQTSLPTLTGIRGEYLWGITAERLLILDVAAILSDHRILVQDGGET